MFFTNIITFSLVFTLIFLLKKKKIDLFGIYIFLIPYQLIKSDIGLTLYGFQLSILLIIFITVLKSIYDRKVNILGFKNFYLILFLFTAIILTTLVPLFNETNIQSSSFFRGEGRFISQIIVFLLSFLAIPLAINYIKNLDDVYKYIKVFVFSLICLLLLGWLQWFTYNITGIDLFPLGQYFDGSSKSGLYDFGGERLFRMSSLGGEPKTLSVSLVIGFFTIHIFNNFNIKFTKYDYFLKYLMLITSFTTLSTSGIVLFIILGVSYILLSKFLRLKSEISNIKKFIYSSFTILGIFLILYLYADTLLKLFELRVLDRNIKGEDFDFVVQQFLISNPIYIFFGSGLGNIHNIAYPFIPFEYKIYMDNTIFTAKSGYLKIISEIGLLGFSLFLLFNYTLIKQLFKININQVINKILIILFLLFLLTFLARTSFLNFYIALFAILNSYQYWYFRNANEN